MLTPVGLLRCEEREEERGACISPRWWLELVTDMANEKDVGPDCLRGVGFIERVEDPAVLSKHKGIRRRCHRNEPKWPWRCGETGK